MLTEFGVVSSFRVPAVSIAELLFGLTVVTLTAVVVQGSGWPFGIGFLACAAIIRFGLLRQEFESMKKPS